MTLSNYVLTGFLLLVLGCGTGSQPLVPESEDDRGAAVQTDPETSPTESYEAILYELGAIPVSKLTKPYWNNGEPGEVFSKGTREDVHGWLSPYLVRRFSYLTGSERQSYGIPKPPLSYERYVALLDVETYQKTKDPLLFAIIEFTLDELLRRKLEINNPDDILQVYHARMGLEDLVLWTLKGRGLTGPMVADLYRQYQDDRLLDYLVPPEAGQDAYKAFLEQLLTDSKIELDQRFVVYTQLYESDHAACLAGYKAFILSNVEQVPHWRDRYAMYEALIRIGDEECVAAVDQALLNDPTAQTRESLLRELQEQSQVVEYLDTIHLLALGKSKPFEIEYYPNAPIFQKEETVLDDSLRACLKQVQKQKTLSKETEQKIQQALQAIADRDAQPESVVGGGGDRFEANPRPGKK
ncbi:hypothetical protein [Gimesia chilikensis]|uniref:hypothetical protein n=1 Tax=Gimesia chilikensis TaxID=2605989 RepID=UPI003A91238E